MIPFAGQVWRILWQGQSRRDAAAAPEGRFHQSGQQATYTSLSEDGCTTAIVRYLGKGNAPREIVAMTVDAVRIADLRQDPAARVVWQDNRAAGQPAPTWALSDRARGAGAQGMLYASRSRPELTDLVVFDPRIILRETTRNALP